MVRLSIPQAKAFARKLISKIHQKNDETREAIMNEVKSSVEYKSLLIDTESLVRNFIKVANEHGLNGCAIQFKYYSTYFLSDYIDKPEGVHECAVKLCESWVQNKAQDQLNKLKWPTESQLVDDIILEAIDAEDLNDLMNKFLAQYD